MCTFHCTPFPQPNRKVCLLAVKIVLYVAAVDHEFLYIDCLNKAQEKEHHSTPCRHQCPWGVLWQYVQPLARIESFTMPRLVSTTLDASPSSTPYTTYLFPMTRGMGQVSPGFLWSGIT